MLTRNTTGFKLYYTGRPKESLIEKTAVKKEILKAVSGYKHQDKEPNDLTYQNVLELCEKANWTCYRCGEVCEPTTKGDKPRQWTLDRRNNKDSNGTKTLHNIAECEFCCFSCNVQKR